MNQKITTNLLIIYVLLITIGSSVTIEARPELSQYSESITTASPYVGELSPGIPWSFEMVIQRKSDYQGQFLSIHRDEPGDLVDIVFSNITHPWQPSFILRNISMTELSYSRLHILMCLTYTYHIFFNLELWFVPGTLILQYFRYDEPC